MRIFGLLIIVVSLSIVVLSAFFGLKLPLNRTECGLYKRRRSDLYHWSVSHKHGT